MNTFRQFASKRPLIFALLMVLLLLVLMGGAAALTIGLLGYEITDTMPQIIGQFVATLGFLFILWRFDWLAASGITRLGSRRLWLATMLILVYIGLSLCYAFFGTLRVDLSLRTEMAPMLVHTTMAGVMEEILLRGLILYALVAVWGRTRWGITAAALVSAFLFGILHLFNLATGQLDLTLLQVTESFVSAILYGGLVLSGGSIWPAVVLHSGLNFVANTVVLNTPDFTLTTTKYLTLIVLDIPLAVVGFYLLGKVSLLAPRTPDIATVQQA